MSQCTQRLLPLCSIPTPTNRDGWAGNNAHIYIPFCGFMFFSGLVPTFPSSTVATNTQRAFRGTTQHGTFVKEGCFAVGAP